MIPCRENSVYAPMHRLPYLRRHHGLFGHSLDELTAFENKLGHLPAFKYSYTSDNNHDFSWAHRSLARLSYKDVSGNQETFKDESAGLSPNESFKSLAESHVTVYGDAFIFKMESNVDNAPGPAKYVHMDQFFIESARLGGTNAKLTLQRLLESGKKEYENSRLAVQGSLS